jgi:uncharacterized protein
MICANAGAEGQTIPAESMAPETQELLERAVSNAEAHLEIADASPRKVRSVTIAGRAGKLEGLLNEGASNAPFTALVCHPHPLGGGTMHNKVVYHAMQVLNRAEWGFGLPVLRFNFRGVGLSEGRHDGKAEYQDVMTGLDWLEREYARPTVLAGFSFGAAMALKACCSSKATGSAGPDKRVRMIAALGLPVQVSERVYRYTLLEAATLPKLFLSGARDEFARPEQLESIVARAADPKKLILVPGADHFFTQQLSAMQQALAGWLKEQLA